MGDARRRGARREARRDRRTGHPRVDRDARPAAVRARGGDARRAQDPDDPRLLRAAAAPLSLRGRCSGGLRGPRRSWARRVAGRARAARCSRRRRREASLDAAARRAVACRFGPEASPPRSTRRAERRELQRLSTHCGAGRCDAVSLPRSVSKPARRSADRSGDILDGELRRGDGRRSPKLLRGGYANAAKSRRSLPQPSAPMPAAIESYRAAFFTKDGDPRADSQFVAKRRSTSAAGASRAHFSGRARRSSAARQAQGRRRARASAGACSRSPRRHSWRIRAAEGRARARSITTI